MIKKLNLVSRIVKKIMEFIEGHIKDNNIQYIKFNDNAPQSMLNEFSKYKLTHHDFAYDINEEDTQKILDKYITIYEYDIMSLLPALLGIGLAWYAVRCLY